jgi:hypothetical protein
VIHKCTCHSPYQDKVYGKGNRVFNPMTGSTKHGRSAIARCTVCGFLLQSSVGVINRVQPELTKVDRSLQLVAHKRLERGREYHRR